VRGCSWRYLEIGFEKSRKNKTDSRVLAFVCVQTGSCG
jgi:hypothetical protein